jgi:hypothetical protein
MITESQKEMQAGERESDRLIASSAAALTSKRKSHAGLKKKNLKGDKTAAPASSAGLRQGTEDAAKELRQNSMSPNLRTKALSEDKILESVPKTLKQKALLFVTNKYFVATMLLATVVALFAMDLWEACGPPAIEYDKGIYSVMLLTFLLFATEFTLLTYSKAGYRFSFFWFLDLLACVSLIPDALMPFGVNIIVMLGDSTATLSITRAGRAARAGTRAVRIIDAVKKILKAREMKRRGEQYSADEEGESSIGGKLGDGITEKVIVIVTLMLIASEVWRTARELMLCFILCYNLNTVYCNSYFASYLTQDPFILSWFHSPLGCGLSLVVFPFLTVH